MQQFVDKMIGLEVTDVDETVLSDDLSPLNSSRIV
jgi:hypothetical protein